MRHVKEMTSEQIEAELEERGRRDYAAEKRLKLERRLEWHRRVDSGLCPWCGKKPGIHWCPNWFRSDR